MICCSKPCAFWSRSTPALEYWSERFQHILIDEFQDVNAAQFRWVQLLSSKHQNICVVGDDDQSIYAWRGANVQIILDFERRYPGAQIIKLNRIIVPRKTFSTRRTA